MQQSSSNGPVGFVELFIGYNDQGVPVIAQPVGQTQSLAECKEQGQREVTKILETDGVPSGAAGVVACIPIPPASAVTHAPAKAPRPTEDQKVTKL